VDAACARRRLVVVEVVRVLGGPEPSCARALALATSSHPAEVGEGGRLIEGLVRSGNLRELVVAGVVPDRGPWRIPRGLQRSVHVALSRLVDAGVLDADLDPQLPRPALSAVG